MKIDEIVKSNFDKIRILGRRLASKLTKRQIMIVCGLLSFVILFFGFFEFSQLLKAVLYYIGFAIVSAQIGILFYIHAVKYAKKPEEETTENAEEQYDPEPIVRRRRYRTNNDE